MTVVEPQVSDSARYPIGEAAKRLGVDRQTLRAHTDLGLIKCGYRRSKEKGVPGRKFYTGIEIRKYWRAQF